jgi:hypothetical protein
MLVGVRADRITRGHRVDSAVQTRQLRLVPAWAQLHPGELPENWNGG